MVTLRIPESGLNRWASGVVATLATLLVSGTLAFFAIPAEALDSCDVVTTEWEAEASTNQGLTNEFARYGNDRKGWSGGDSTFSVPLSAKRNVWLFSDTFVGEVNEDGTQPLDTGFVNSSFVVQHKDKLRRTVTGGTTSEPVGLVPPDENGWYWLGAGQLADDGSSLDVLFQRYERFGDGQWDWAWSHSVLARFNPNSLKLQETVSAPSNNGVAWGSWVLREGDHTLIYGVEDLGSVKYMHLARVWGDDLSGQWEFWNGATWSTIEESSVRIMPGVANEYSVSPFHDGYLLVTQDTTVPFNAEILGYVSCSPTGPFVEAALLYTTPEAGPYGTYGNPNIFTYNAHEHPQFRDGNTLMMTYNVNSFDWTELYDDVTIYRPRFIDVTLNPVELSLP